MLGGYQIIDLRKIGLEMSSETQTFTDAEILKQLRNLRDHIEKGHDYTKPLNRALKPILIRYRDGKLNEKEEVSAFALIKNSNASLTYEIITNKLMIEVVFEEKTDDDGNKYYDIKTAKYLYNNNVIVEGDLTVGGDASIGGDLAVTDDASIGGDLGVTGDVTGTKFIGNTALESIKDASGHNRFIEGDITPEVIEGVEYTYAKWSLSGTHLLVVLAGSIDNGITIGGTIANLDLPTWVKDKIITTYGNSVVRQSDAIYASDGSTSQNAINVLAKSANNIYVQSYVTTTAKRYFRYQFDLLIDNEEE